MAKRISEVIVISLFAIVSFVLFIVGFFLPSNKFFGLFGARPVPAQQTLLVRILFCGLSMVACVTCCSLVYRNIHPLSKKKRYMKIITAVLSGLFIFIMVWFITGMLLLWIWPYSSTIITVGNIQANVASLIGLVAGILAGQHSFRASLRSKTGRLCRNTNKEVNGDKQKKR